MVILSIIFYKLRLTTGGLLTTDPFKGPPRSPGMSVLDYFVWGAIKDEVYNLPLTTKENCMERVTNAFRGLSPNAIRAATHEQLILRCEKCHEAEGRNFEHLLN